MRTSTRAIAAVALAAAVAGSACTSRGPHQDHQNRRLFGPRTDTPVEGEGEGITVDAGTVDPDSDEVQIDLPDGTVNARRDRVIRRGARDFSWFGRTEGRSDANVQITVLGDEVSAHVDTDEGAVATHTKGRGVGLRTRLDPSRLKEDTDPEAVVPEGAAADAAAEPEVEVQAVGDTVIDVMIVYNSAVARSYGTSVKAVAQRMIDKANKSFTDSQIRLQYRLVHVTQVADAEIARRGSDNLGALQRSTVVGNLRNQYGADLVQAWGTYPDVCGQGWQPTVAYNYGSQYGFSVINNNRSCIEGVAVSHELGHNIGGGHDRITSGRSSGGGDAYGMVDRNNKFLTIMGYETSCGGWYRCTQTWTFSNPKVQFRGIPTGVAGSVDNARNISIVGARVAAYRAARV